MKVWGCVGGVFKIFVGASKIWPDPPQPDRPLLDRLVRPPPDRPKFRSFFPLSSSHSVLSSLFSGYFRFFCGI